MPDPSPYDSIAGLYHSLWADWYLPAARPALETLFFSEVSAGASVLDVCCGSGHVTGELVQRGYRVTGVDVSAELIARAQSELPAVDFRVMDVRHLQLERSYDAALSTFDSLNHILSLIGLRQVFAGVYQALAPGGLFVFDMNLEQAYLADLRQWAVSASDESVSLVRGAYDTATKIASTELIWFKRQTGSHLWERRRSVVEERCYKEQDIIGALAETGFISIMALPAAECGVSSELGYGRIFYSGRSSSVGENS
ncbi:MAG TPA: class I SAM-dependent methyltransferase [Bryobacteraceae bacterium]|jgi:SAM-dependent methyltransferase|nr:class I SAM-dependent methyltransferase [Bryobacteraceae bacterium]